MDKELEPIHISDIEALEKAIIDDVTARKLALLKQTVDACYRKKFIDKAYEWLLNNVDNYLHNDKFYKSSLLVDFKKAMENES